MNSLVIIQISIFIIISILIILVSFQSLLNPKSHGFYRFFVFETVIILVIINIPYWFINPFSLLHIISWFLLILSLIVVIQGFYLLLKKGGSKKRELDSENYEFENTVNLVETGIYKYIRHPLYCSLVIGAWGVLLKNITFYGIVLAVIVTLFAIAAAKVEEKENILFFGSAYEDYMKKTKMLIPYLY